MIVPFSAIINNQLIYFIINKMKNQEFICIFLKIYFFFLFFNKKRMICNKKLKKSLEYCCIIEKSMVYYEHRIL